MARLYLLGDSHAQALGPRLRALLPEHTVSYEAFPGSGTRTALSKARLPAQVDVVAVALGGNDFGDQSAAWAELVRAVRAANPGAKLLWFGPFTAIDPKVALRHDAQAEAQGRGLPALGVDWRDTRPWSRTGHAPDGVHFTTSGYDALAHAMQGPFSAAASGGGAGTLAGIALAGFGAWWWLRRRRRA